MIKTCFLSINDMKTFSDVIKNSILREGKNKLIFQNDFSRKNLLMFVIDDIMMTSKDKQYFSTTTCEVYPNANRNRMSNVFTEIATK